ncbi:COG3014 family protein [Ghiorsea bivora]|uniref:COG3014 family protein n=1 Tax=Ghiorsea bivora TaxID=1485545 RepID=UPI00056E168B|nr:hypothetical protein [Ghiorsea bivora]
MNKRVVWLPLAVFFAVLSGCASYSQGFQKVELLLSQQKPELALQELEKNPSTGTDKLLYLLDKAMLQRMSGLYEASNTTFEQAKALMDKLEATSVTEQLGALTINDSAMSYEGEDYEQTAVHIYAALNYIELGLWDEARVEALQIDERIKRVKEKRDGKAVEDPFASYLMGFIFEQEGEYSDAMIAYRDAYQTYQKYQQPTPLFLQRDLLRLSKYLDLRQEYQTYITKFGIKEKYEVAQLQKQGEIILLIHHSLAPIKRAHETLVYSSTGVPLRISLPVYQSRPSYIHQARLLVGNRAVQTVMVDSFDKLARLSLKTHRAAMTARLIARALIKKQAAHQAEDKGGALAGFLVDVAGMVTETADTRSWLTLPKNILLARLPLPAGTYFARLELLGPNGHVVQTVDLGDITLTQGRKRVIEKSFIGPYLQ